MTSVTFPVYLDGKAQPTPGKHPFTVPTKALADAIAAEWQAHKKFAPSKMPLTSLAYTAIDRIHGQEAQIIEALLVYVDTDTLSYRATSSETLAQRQQGEWDPILAWAGKKFGARWEVTSGVMPLQQPKALHDSLQKYLQTLNAMRLSAACLLASGLSSLALALAVLEKRVDAAEAFRLSRLEEEAQAERWGRDADSDGRAQRLKDEVLTAERFLRLLDAP